MNYRLKVWFLTTLLNAGCLVSVYGQDSSAPTISDEDLKQYAVVMDSINDLTEQLKNRLSGLIKNNPKISEARYNQLSQLGNDQEKLKAAKATPEELAALQEINLRRTEETIKLSEILKSLTTQKLGSELYSKIRTALKSDPEVKARYEKIVSDLKKKP
ncbi:MAG: hypothetical protein L6Q51_10205 [Cyclobacteriaceae bacterium]|nr:hypothetical protein [Cyclobacteriaceae bacterium]